VLQFFKETRDHSGIGGMAYNAEQGILALRRRRHADAYFSDRCPTASMQRRQLLRIPWQGDYVVMHLAGELAVILPHIAFLTSRPRIVCHVILPTGTTPPNRKIYANDGERESIANDLAR
jgi:hypothetical protein